ncbi:MAG: AsmA-like C-terminal domain-containing protein [Syntrophobacteraceae bacterium]
MRKTRKIILWSAAVAGGLCILATMFVLAISFLFNAGVIGGNLTAALEARCHLRADQIRIAFRPFPVVALHRVSAVVPGKFSASVGAVYLHLEVLPLLTGQMKPTQIELANPVISVKLPGVSGPENSFFVELQELVKNYFPPPAAMEPLTLIARDGSLDICNASCRTFSFGHIDFQSEGSHGSLGFRLTSGRSSFWKSLEFKGKISPGDLTGSGLLHLTEVNPQNLESFLAPSASRRVKGSIKEITAALFYTGPGRFRTNFTTTVPSFAFGIGDRAMTIKDGFLAGALKTDAKSTQLSISDFRSASPHLSLAASCAENPEGTFTLSVDGGKTDVGTLRTLLLALNRKPGPIDHFFEVLQEGQLPKLHFTAHANTFSDLLKLKNQTLQCSVEKGVVLAPKADLLVTNVSANLAIQGGVLSATDLSGHTRGSSTQGGELIMGLPHDNPLFHLDLPLTADLSELPAVLHRVVKNDAFQRELARISDVTGKTRGRLVIGEKLGALVVKVSTDRFRFSCNYSRLPGQVSMEGSSFSMDGDNMAVHDVDGALAGSTLSASGSLKDYAGPHTIADLQLKGHLGPQGYKIAAFIAGLPTWIKPQPGLDIRSSTLTWTQGTQTSFSGKLRLSDGTLVEPDVVKTPDKLSIRQLAIKDGDSDARIAVDSLQGGYRIGFSGTLGEKTLAELVTGKRPFRGPVSGRFNADLYSESPEKSSGLGKVVLSGFHLPGLLPASVSIDKAEIEAHGKKLDIKSAVADWEGSRFMVTGGVTLTGSSYQADLDASTNSLDLDRILKAECSLPKAVKKPASGTCPLGPAQKSPWDMPVAGVVRVQAVRLSYEKMTWAPARGEVLLGKGPVHIRLTRANVCRIPVQGNIVVQAGGADISLDINADHKDLQSTMSCFFKKQRLLSGSYELTGHVETKNPCTFGENQADISRSLEGKVAFLAKNGRVFRFNVFTKIISLLSISEIYRGVLPNLLAKGCPYKTLQVQGTIKDGRLILADSFLDGPSIKMVFSGQIDLVSRKMNVIALVAPQRTVERVVNATPVLGHVLKEAFVTVPVRISGNVEAPSVVLLSPGAVGHELLGVMQRLIKLPFTIFQAKTW